MNLPNALTILRIGLVPLLVTAMLAGDAWMAAAVFAAGAASDVLDGRIARSRGLVTTFGKLADPLADKLLVGAALACLVVNQRLALWVMVVVLAREAAVSALRFWAKRQGVVISARQLGKAKMSMQTCLVLALILAANPAAAWLDVLTIATVAITVISGIEYFLAFWRGQEDRELRRAPARA